MMNTSLIATFLQKGSTLFCRLVEYQATILTVDISNQPRVIILAGPNGAGKTTLAQEYLPNEADCPIYINADLIAAGLAPFSPESAAIKAGKLMLAEMNSNFLATNNFAIETTLSGRAHARHIENWRISGYNVKLIFLKLDNVDVAIERVAQRVAHGGHHIPEDTIRRRFVKGLWNLEHVYKPIVDSWYVYDNSGDKAVLHSWSKRK